MKLLRTISTRRLVGLLAALVAAAVAVAALAVAASGSGGTTPPAKPLADAIHDSLAGPDVAGVTARVTFTNKLFPSGALLGNAGPVLMSGGSGRLWLTNDGRGRLELQSDAGDAQIVWRPGSISVYDASSNTVYRATLPTSSTNDTGDTGAAPTLAQITDALTRIGTDVALSAADPTNVAGVPAYAVSLSPKHDGGLLGSVAVAWDAEHAVPLRAAVYAQGSSSPVLELTTNDITYGPVSSDTVDVAPPADAKVTDLGALTPGQTNDTGSGAAITGLDAVRAAAGFPVTAPDTLVGLPRRDVRLVGSSDHKAAVVTYGQGLGAIVVVQRPAPAGGTSGGTLDSLPKVSLDGVTAHELATQLGTILTWEKGGIATVIAGSVPAASAEAAARELA
jgi:outer membrane lipoprotein-sorting protein